MRALHLGLRVADLERSLAFYAALGYEVVGSVPGTSLGDLTMIKLPDDPFVTIELVSRSSASASTGEDRLSHFVVKVESMDTVVSELAAESGTRFKTRFRAWRPRRAAPAVDGVAERGWD